MALFEREFESSDRLIVIMTKDFTGFSVFTRINHEIPELSGNFNGEFTVEDLNGIGWNSEREICKFLEQRYRLENVYSLHDFREVKK